MRRKFLGASDDDLDMELIQVAIAAAVGGVGGALAFLVRRPTIARPPKASVSDPAGSNPDRPLATVMLRKKTSLGTSSVVFNDANLAADAVRELAQGKGWDKVNQLMKLMPDAATDAVPEARLAYPGSTIVLTTGERIAGTGAVQSSTDYKTTFASDSDSDQVVAWYQDWLATHGWQPVVVDGSVTGTAHDFARGSEHFRLTLADSAAVRAVVAVPIPDDAKTIYEVEYKNSLSTPPVS